MYLFTDVRGKKILKITSNRTADTANKVRRELSDKTGKPVIVWCHVYGENPKLKK